MCSNMCHIIDSKWLFELIPPLPPSSSHTAGIKPYYQVCISPPNISTAYLVRIQKLCFPVLCIKHHLKTVLYFLLWYVIGIIKPTCALGSTTYTYRNDRAIIPCCIISQLHANGTWINIKYLYGMTTCARAAIAKKNYECICTCGYLCACVYSTDVRVCAYMCLYIHVCVCVLIYYVT